MTSTRITPPGLRTGYHAGHLGLESLAAEYEQLVAEAGAPVTASMAWLRATLPADSLPWTLTVRSASGRLEAAAVLLDGRLDGVDTPVTTMAATLDGFTTGIPARDQLAAEALARALAQQLRRRMRRRTHVRLGPLVADDVSWTVTAELHGLLAVTAETSIPQLVRDARIQAELYMSDNMRRTVRKAQNRLRVDGRNAMIRFTADPALVLAATPAMAVAHRDSDQRHGIPSLLSTAAGEAAWRSRLGSLLDARALTAGLLTVDQTLAAYVLVLPDPPACRVREGCFSSEFSRYAPGRLLEAAAVQQMLDQPEFTRLDWMTSVASETLIAQNHQEPVIVLTSAPGAAGGSARTPRPRSGT
jgi:hypothetical protein